MSIPENPDRPVPASPPKDRSAAPPAPEKEPLREHVRGLTDQIGGEEEIDRRLAEIEMIGEEAALGWKPAPHEPLSPEVRFLHVSRTIHELVTDRNRSVGIFLAVASILVAAATGLLNVKPDVAPMAPLRVIQRWCLPATFATLAVMAIFISLLLIRARIGLIHEVAKLNALLGLPSKRVERVNPLSIFYLMHLLVVVLGGASAGLAMAMLVYGALAPEAPAAGEVPGAFAPIASGILVALAYVAGLLSLYYVTILRATTDAKLGESRLQPEKGLSAR